MPHQFQLAVLNTIGLCPSGALYRLEFGDTCVLLLLTAARTNDLGLTEYDRSFMTLLSVACAQ